MPPPPLDDLGTAGKLVASSHDPSVTLHDYIVAQIGEIAGLPVSNLARRAITMCVGTIFTVVRSLDTSDETHVKVVQNRAFEFSKKIDDCTEIDDRVQATAAVDMFKALDIQEKGQKDGFQCNREILTDVDTVRANIAVDNRNLASDVDTRINEALAVNREGKDKWAACGTSIDNDLAGMKKNMADIDAETGKNNQVMTEKKAVFDTTLKEIAEQKQVVIHKMGGGLFGSLAADLQTRRADTTNANDYHIAFEVHSNCTATLTKLRAVGADQMARHNKALGVVNSIIAVHDRIEDLLKAVGAIIKAELKVRLDGPIPTADTPEIISNRKYEQLLLKKSMALLFILLPRDYREVQTKLDHVNIIQNKLETLRKQLRTAFQLRNREAMTELQKLIKELEEELVTAEANLVKENVRFKECVEESRYAESRRRLIEVYGETEESLGPSALEVVKEMPPSLITTDCDDVDPDFLFLTAT